MATRLFSSVTLEKPSCSGRTIRAVINATSIRNGPAGAHVRFYEWQVQGLAPLASPRLRRGDRQVVCAGEVAEVAELLGVRLTVDEEKNKPQVEYLVRWKDGAPNSWEAAQNLSSDLLRDFENKWWQTCRKGDIETMRKLLTFGKKMLANTVDANRRNALHFAAAIGSVDCCKLLIEAGADVNFPDVEGYTPLHMAAGYLSTATVQAMLDAGADPEQKDRKGRSPLELVESIRQNFPNNPNMLARRVALEEVARILTENLFEDVVPAQILAAREASDGTREFLVTWSDGSEPSWVAQKYVADDVIQDYDDGLEYAEAEEILEEREGDGLREYLVRWSDGLEDSWEPRRNLSADLLGMWEAKKRGEEYKGSKNGNGGAGTGGAMGASTPMASAMASV